MKIIEQIKSTLQDAPVIGVTVGLFFTAVEVEVQGKVRCGLAASLTNPNHLHSRKPAIREVGRLDHFTALELADLALSESHTEASVGLAAINALLPRMDHFVELSAAEYIARNGRDKQVALIGHFPFVNSLRKQVKKLWVLELTPGEDDLPASAAPEIIPSADILAITATTLINNTFEALFSLRKPDAKVMIIGPSTPLSLLMFQYGIHVLFGSYVESPENVLPLIRQGANFRQIHPQGVRLVTIERETFK